VERSVMFPPEFNVPLHNKMPLIVHPAVLTVAVPDDNVNDAPQFIVILLKLVVPYINAFELVKITVLEPALNVPPPKLSQALGPPFNVSCESVPAFNTAPLFRVMLFISVDPGRVGSFGVVEASGIMISLVETGVFAGVQLPTSVHDVLIDPFQVTLHVLLFANVFVADPNCDEYVHMGASNSETQLCMVSLASLFHFITPALGLVIIVIPDE